MCPTRSTFDVSSAGSGTNGSPRGSSRPSVIPHVGLSYRLNDRFLARLRISPTLSVSVVKAPTGGYDSGPAFALTVGWHGLGW